MFWEYFYCYIRIGLFVVFTTGIGPNGVIKDYRKEWLLVPYAVLFWPILLPLHGLEIFIDWAVNKWG